MKIQAAVTYTTQPTPEPPPELDPAKRYWRGLHEVEGGRIPDPTQTVPYPPAVIPPYNPTLALEMTEAIQWMSYDLMRSFCDEVNGQRWRILHRVAIAMNNGAANGYDGGNPHRDYINRIDLTENKLNGTPNLPRYDKMQRAFQGSLISGSLMGNYITCTPGIDAIDARNFIYPRGTNDPNTRPDQIAPEAQVILKRIIKNFHYQIFVCAANPPFHARGQWGAGCWIAYPFILDRVVSFEARFFVEWNKSTPPDPVKVYLPK